MKKISTLILNFFTVISIFSARVVPSNAQELDVAYVISPPEVVELMMDISDIGTGDYVIDLGTGDGRILIAAVKRGALGHGVDLDPQRITEAREHAEREGVSDRTTFIQEDLFESDLSRASVITMYLNSEVNLKLRSSLLSLQPGTRMQTLSNNNGNFLFHDVYYWVVPADASGTWQWQSGQDDYEMKVQQNYQLMDVSLTVKNQPLQIETSYLIGKRINVTAMNPQTGLKLMLSGTIENDTIAGYLHKQQDDTQSLSVWSVDRY
jgi:hypothetical protein